MILAFAEGMAEEASGSLWVECWAVCAVSVSRVGMGQGNRVKLRPR